MVIKGKILGQASPTSGVLTLIYTVPANTTTTTNIFMANISNGIDYFSVALIANGETPSNKNWIAFKVPLNIGEIISFNGIALAEGDMVMVKSENGGCAFTLTGIEN